MTSRFLVYGLIDPRTCELRYVGKSSSGRSRPTQHGSEWARKRQTPLGVWLREVYEAAGRAPAILILKECETNEEALEVEIESIKFFRDLDVALVNVTAGGQGSLGRPVTQKTRDAVARTSRNRVFTPEMHARLKESHKHLRPPPMTPEGKLNMIAKLTGRKNSPELVAKKAAASKAMWARPGYRERMSAERKRKYKEDSEFRARVEVGLSIGRALHQVKAEVSL